MNVWRWSMMILFLCDLHASNVDVLIINLNVPNQKKNASEF